jgi:hypothetical protein
VEAKSILQRAAHCDKKRHNFTLWGNVVLVLKAGLQFTLGDYLLFKTLILKEKLK